MYRVFKLGGKVGHVIRHVWQLFNVKRSKVNVTRSCDVSTDKNAIARQCMAVSTSSLVGIILSNKQIVAVARYSSCGIAIRQVLTVLWVTRCFRVMTTTHKTLYLARYMLSLCVYIYIWLVYVSVHLSVCLSQAGAVSKRLNGSSRF